MTGVKTKKCKSCGVEIVKLAKLCPECGAKQKMGLGKKILIGFGILIVLVWMIPDSKDKPSVPTTATAPEKTPEEIAKEKAEAEAEAAKISDADKELLKKAYSDLDTRAMVQFDKIEEKYKKLTDTEKEEFKADFERLSNEKIAYQAKLAEEQKKQAEAKAAEEKAAAEAKAAAEKAAAYKAWVDGQFSAWDGSNRYLVDLLKDNLNDPDSFDHVETTYKDMGDHLIVKMTYRAKNAFGALILQNVTAESDYKTNTIKITATNS